MHGFHLRDAIEEYVRIVIGENSNCEHKRENENALIDDELHPSDWEHRRCIKEILLPFKQWTLRLQHRYSDGCIADILPAMDELLAHLEDMKVQFCDQPVLVQMIENGWLIMDKYLISSLQWYNYGIVLSDKRYYLKTQLCPAYTIVVALHPNMKLLYFREEWKDRSEWITLAETVVDDVWKICYPGYGVANPITAPYLRGEDPASEEESLSHWERKHLAAIQLNDNFDMMTSSQQELQLHRVQDAVQYWVERSQHSQGRDLARMALTYLTLPAMSAKLERVFSGAKITLSDRQCTMGEDAVEAVECLKSWQQDILISATRDDIRAVEEMLDALCEEAIV